MKLFFLLVLLCFFDKALSQGSSKKTEFPFEVNIEWGVPQKIKKSGKYVRFEEIDQQIIYHVESDSERNSYGEIEQVDNLYELDTQSLNLTYVGSVSNSKEKRGTKNFVVTSVMTNILNYARNFRYGYITDPVYDLTISIRNVENKSLYLKNLKGDLQFLESEDVLYIFCKSSSGLSIISVDLFGVSKEIFFPSSDLLDKNFRTISLFRLNSDSTSLLKASFFIRSFVNDTTSELSVLDLAIDIENKSLISKEIELDMGSQRIDLDYLRSCEVIYSNDIDNEICHVAFFTTIYYVRMLPNNTNPDGTMSYPSYEAYIKHSPIFFIENVDGQFEMRKKFKSTHREAHLHYMREFRNGVLFIGQEFKASQQLIIGYYDLNTYQLNYSYLYVDEQEQLFGAALLDLSGNDNRSFNALVTIYQINKYSKIREAIVGKLSIN